MSGAGDHSDERGPQENPPGVPPAGASPTGEGQLDNSANHRQYYILNLKFLLFFEGIFIFFSTFNNHEAFVYF